ncbi:MAG: GntR family transcriptional regulator [Thermodesulfobacteriota bacterium]
MLLTINPNDAVPIYVQIVRQVQLAIVSGELRPGDRLPSLRELARDLVVNHLTVKKAYAVLEAQGLIRTRRGLGTFVADTIPGETRDVLHDQLSALVDTARRLGMSRQQIVARIGEVWKVTGKSSGGNSFAKGLSPGPPSENL